jgi:FAD/FMN-containing dehydrogenase
MATLPRPMSALIDGLRAIVGDRGLLLGEDAASRSCDPFRRVPPEAGVIVRPASTDEVAAVLALCYARGQRVVTHGGRTGLAGGAYADASEIVLSLERMAKIEEIDSIGQTAQVQAGATLEAVHSAAAAQDLLYPVDLGAKGSATIGGTIATNAGGNHVIRWGMTRQNVLGLEAVLSDGTVVQAMNRLLKNNTGYDLKHIFAGSEGTLGVVTRAVLRLVPAPRSQSVAFLSVGSFAAVLELLARSRRLLTLSSFEVMWRDYYELMAASGTGRRPVAPGQPFYVLIETLGYNEKLDSSLFSEFLEGAQEANLIADGVSATSGQQATDLWHVREGSEVIVREMSPFVSFDISVDVRHANSFVERAHAALSHQFGTAVRTVTLGHLGDNNLHLAVHIGPGTLERELDVERCVYDIVREFGGALTAEHGVGRFRREFLPEHVSVGALETMGRIRDALDPHHLLNREVLF